MTEAPRHLIATRAGVTRVLRLVAHGQRIYPLRYDVRLGRPGVCAGCGCTERHGCLGGCCWVDASKTICSRCFTKVTR